VAQGVGPEFKPQYHKKKRKEEECKQDWRIRVDLQKVELIKWGERSTGLYSGKVI
jgi:hypothetical protein